MALLGLISGRTRPYRLLKALIGELKGIRLAFERQNALYEAEHPAAARALMPSDRVDSAISYADPREIAAAERIRAEHLKQTGHLLEDDELTEKLMRGYREYLGLDPASDR